MEELYWRHERDDPLERLRAEVVARNKDREHLPRDRSIEEVMEARRADERPSDDLDRFQKVARQLFKVLT